MVALNQSTIQNGWTALEKASIRGHHKVVEVLLGKGANPNLQNKVRTRHNRIVSRCLTFGDRSLHLLSIMHCKNIYVYFVLIVTYIEMYTLIAEHYVKHTVNTTYHHVCVSCKHSVLLCFCGCSTCCVCVHLYSCSEFTDTVPDAVHVPVLISR